MAVDLKAATPDTTFDWATAGLFGADSQAAPSPSYFPASDVLAALLALANTWTAKQTITPPANTEALAVTGYSVTGANTQSLLDLAGTWNTSGLPTAIKLNITDTASNAASLLADLQVGGSSKFSVDKTGIVQAATRFHVGTSAAAGMGTSKLCVSSIGVVQWTGSASAFTAGDTILGRDAAGALGLRNGANAQAFRVYGTYTDASNFERGALNAGADYIELAAETAGTGDDDLDVRLTPAGAGKVRFGVVTGNADAAVNGYVTIKDAAGNTVKLATIA